MRRGRAKNSELSLPSPFRRGAGGEVINIKLKTRVDRGADCFEKQNFRKVEITIYIFSQDKELIDNLQLVFGNDLRFHILYGKPGTFCKGINLNFVNLPTTILDEFGSKPQKFESQVLRTNNKYGLADYAVTMPNFVNALDTSTELQTEYSIKAPLKAVLEFSKDKILDIRYGLHTEYAFYSLEDIDISVLELIKSYFLDVLNDYGIT